MTIYFIKHENDFKEFVSMNVKAAELWKPKNSLNQSKKKQQKPEELNKDSREQKESALTDIGKDPREKSSTIIM